MLLHASQFLHQDCDKKKCLFCNKKAKKHQGHKQKLLQVATANFESSIRQYAQWLNDQPMLTKIRNIDFVAKEVLYHGIGRVQYQKSAESSKYHCEKKSLIEMGPSVSSSIKITSQTDWHEARRIHNEAFEALCFYVDDTVIKNNQVIHLTDLNSRYSALVYEIGGDQYCDVLITSQKLEAKLTDFYGEKIRILKGKTKQGNLVCNSSIDFD